MHVSGILLHAQKQSSHAVHLMSLRFNASPSSPSLLPPLPKSLSPPSEPSLPTHSQHHLPPLSCASRPWWLVVRRSPRPLALTPLRCRLRARRRRRNRRCSPRFLRSTRRASSPSSSSCFLGNQNSKLFVVVVGGITTVVVVGGVLCARHCFLAQQASRKCCSRAV
jgi:hypothetical protein